MSANFDKSLSTYHKFVFKNFGVAPKKEFKSICINGDGQCLSFSKIKQGHNTDATDKKENKVKRGKNGRLSS